LEAGAFVARDDDDVTFVDKGIGHGDGSIEIAARIVAQVKHQPDQLIAGLLP
jgi:hypothetical protein